MSSSKNVFSERTVSIGSERELDDIHQLQNTYTVLPSFNFKNQQKVKSENMTSQPKESDRDYLCDSPSQPAEAEERFSKEVNQWNIDSLGLGDNIPQKTAESWEYEPSHKYSGEPSYLNSPSRKKSKKHRRKIEEDENYTAEDEGKRKHRKKKKSKQNEESLDSNGTYTVEAFENQGFHSSSDKLPPKPPKREVDALSIESNGTYTLKQEESGDETGNILKDSIRSMFKRMKSTVKITDLPSRQKISSKTLTNQKKAANFISSKIKQRECSRFALDHESDKYHCQCGRNREWHQNRNIPVEIKRGKEIWDSKTHTHEQQCDSFGEISFRGFGHDTTNSPYVRLVPNTDLIDVWDILIKHWGLPVPKLLISVTGGAKQFEMKTRLKSILKQGLIHAATSTGAWIVTGGTAAGVMEFVGEAVRDHIFSTGNPEQNRVVALGIASWGVISNNFALDGEGDKGIFPAVYSVQDVDDYDKRIPLDHNHTHFLLVDNGTEGKYGGEIKFRTRLESFISQKVETGVATTQSVHVPCVLIVVEGGINTMKTVLESLRNNTPVVAIEGTGRCADLIAYGFKLTKNKNDEDKCIKNKRIDQNLTDMARRTCFDNKNNEKINMQIAQLVIELKECLEKRRLLNVFSLERADVKEIDRAILYALLKANKSDANSQLALALAWNRCDIAKQEIFTPFNRKRWEPRTLYDAMLTALVQDRGDFVQLFLDNGVDFQKFLTKATLRNLYSLCINDYMDANGEILRYMIGYTQQTWANYFMCRDPKVDNDDQNILTNVSEILVILMKDSAMDIYKGTEFAVEGPVEMKWVGNIEILNSLKERITQQNLHQPIKGKKMKKKIIDSYDFDFPVRELFIWAVLFNRRRLAHLFWKLGTDQLGAALVACSLLKQMANKAEQEEELELSVDLNEHAVIFEKLATNVLAQCYSQDKRMAQQLLTREQTLWGRRTLFQIANQNTLMDFLEHSCCQTKLNTIWKGTMALYTSELKICICILCPLLLPFIKFSTHKTIEDIVDDEDEDDEDAENVAETDFSGSPSGNKVVPVEGFTEAKSRKSIKIKKKRTYAVDYFKCDRNNVNIISAVVFFYSAPVSKFYTGLIAYLCFLGIFTFFVLTDLRPADVVNSPSVYEYITWGWLSTMVIEEIRQIFVLDQPPTYKLRNWISSIWNRFDLAMYVMFLISVILRYTIFTSEFIWARMGYSITLAMFYLRLMQSFFVAKNMGPKVIMIEKMLTDLFFFFLILLVFIMSFGIAYSANLYPNSQPSWVILKNIMYMPYWQMYGELFLERIEGDDDPESCTRNETIWRNDLSLRCPEKNAIVPILLAVYMILTNILLVNLLIAMFSYTFQTIQDNSMKVWRFYRLSLIYELFDRPALVPPLIILNHLYRLLMYLVNSTCGSFQTKNDFKEQLEKEENIRMSLFERGAMENYLSHSLMRERELLDNKVSSTAERLEMVIDELAQIKDSVSVHDSSTDVTDDSDKLMPIDDSDKLITQHARSRVSDEVTYLRHCLDDLTDQMGRNTAKLNQMMHLMEDVIRKPKSHPKTMDLEIQDATTA
ncbi:transient receptor potential cation channel subfamily M member 2 [Patella vulgata]|uniref:transient receptor potential cation channel subfamily M member 2 n=1 Tax=Patella vulgata TaxID=6465 RepID=UPI0024A97E8A|nr:transient receptor potential cation channel subfamily M member 2 [Patella vulgata]XP_050394394.2 transient receptor potential cation channel subfamily M member 2 [Patella vulgata]